MLDEPTAQDHVLFICVPMLFFFCFYIVVLRLPIFARAVGSLAFKMNEWTCACGFRLRFNEKTQPHEHEPHKHINADDTFQPQQMQINSALAMRQFIIVLGY